jgi:hypothetical protein
MIGHGGGMKVEIRAVNENAQAVKVQSPAMEKMA